MRRSRRIVAAVLGVLVLSSVIAISAPVAAAEPPSVRVFASSSAITVERGREDWVYLDPGIWMAAIGGTFELRATRTDYDSPIVLEQVDASTGATLRTLAP